MSQFLSPHARQVSQCVDTPERVNFLVSNCGVNGARGKNVLGRGGFGIVLKATYRGTRVAVKVVDLHHQHCRESLENEGNILGWKHSNIIQILKITSGEHHGLVIMERVSGDNLQSILNTVCIGRRSALEILCQVASGLIYCHCRGIIHGDLKPQNILITITDDKNGFLVKLCDFGSSFAINEHTKGNECRGTIRYMAPEALKAGSLSPKIDIYSFGVTMWQIKCRKVPYEEIHNNHTIAYRVVREGLRPDICQEISRRIPKIFLNSGSLKTDYSVSPRKIKSESLNINTENSQENLSRSLNALLKEAKIENHVKSPVLKKKIPWRKILTSKKWIENEELASNYRDLFTICWHEDPKCRPEASELLSQLQKFASKTTDNVFTLYP
ncbi:serine/threonine-protein kinase mos-like [Phlebotomus argentipes]|uniref:serine/threonine-protein kinase mos-like n=1 Tax=Phlebotomus argentipes TaxID=94469 RepID=UPI0028935BEE|nr:serine/threonine-protein kinase mos-like [Phlebotomus argentipes]